MFNFFCLGVRKKRKGYEDDEYVTKKSKMDEVSKPVLVFFLFAKT